MIFPMPTYRARSFADWRTPPTTPESPPQLRRGLWGGAALEGNGSARGFRQRLQPGLWCLVLALGLGQPCRAAVGPIRYLLDLREPAAHLVRVTMTVPEAAPSTEFQFPAWNNLYQIRDFVRNVEELRASCDGQPEELERRDLNTWRSLPTPCANLELRYAVFAHEESPFSSSLDQDHAFLNFALLLFYLPQERARGVRVQFLLPEGWKLATVLEGEGADFQAPDYDVLADSPAEAGHFQEYNYTQDVQLPGPNSSAGSSGRRRATYRVIVHADPADYSAGRLLASLEKITDTETALMRDVPFSRYTFILHFPREGGGGGMEHRNGTAISVPASQLRDHWESLEGVAAHEFFHLWNVKRIRPQALEPIDYVRGNDTRDLWFSEGVTSTYGELCLLRAGLITPQVFYARLAESVRALQERPARAFQSVETSGREAWLEKYPDYSRPERSISYYNKGALLGFLLDLAIRHASHNQASLDDVMRRLNEDFARPGRFFTLADLGAIVRSLAPSYAGLDAFLRDDVQGTHELDYDTYLTYAGLRLLRQTEEIPAWDFVAMRSFEGHIEVESVDPGSNAQKAGLQRGDVLLKMNGKPLFALRDLLHSSYRPGQRVKFDVHRRQGDAVVEYALEGKEGTTYRVEELPHPTAEQRQVRGGWLRGTTGIVGAHGVRPVGGRAPLAPTSTIEEGRP